MKRIKELQERKKLSEGRNFGIGFSILNKKNNGFETFLPFTACRDYLNDFSYVEYTKKEISSIHGYNHKLLNCFKNKRIFYLGVNTLNHNYGTPWVDKYDAQKILIDNHKVLESFLNNIELEIGLKGKSKILIDEDVLIIKVPIYWSKTTALISAYTLFIRCFFNIDSENLKLSTDELFKIHKPFIDDDRYMILHCKAFCEKINKIKFEKINYSQFKIAGNYAVHNFGIQGFLSSYNSIIKK